MTSLVGRSVDRRISAVCRVGSMTPATLFATWSCSSKTSSNEPSKRSAQRCAPGCGLYQLGGDPDATASLADGTFKDVADAQFATDPLHIWRLALVGKARIPGDDEEPADTGQRRDDLLDDAIREIFLIRITAHILEREHRNRGLVG